jgi:hypothetical protein
MDILLAIAGNEARREQGLAIANASLTSAESTSARLNGFFAFSVNSPSMSMVNFSCCVDSASLSARRVTRRVTPQPMRAAVRMEAGDACF